MSLEVYGYQDNSYQDVMKSLKTIEPSLKDRGKKRPFDYFRKDNGGEIREIKGKKKKGEKLENEFSKQEISSHLNHEDSPLARSVRIAYIRAVDRIRLLRVQKGLSSNEQARDAAADFRTKVAISNKQEVRDHNMTAHIEATGLGKASIRDHLVSTHKRFAALCDAVYENNVGRMKSIIGEIRSSIPKDKPMIDMQVTGDISFKARNARYGYERPSTIDESVNIQFKDVTHAWNDDARGTIILSTSYKDTLEAAKADTRAYTYTIPQDAIIRIQGSTHVAANDIDFEKTLEPNRPGYKAPEDAEKGIVFHTRKGYKMNLNWLTKFDSEAKKKLVDDILGNHDAAMKEHLDNLEGAIATGDKKLIAGRLQKIIREDEAFKRSVTMVEEKMLPLIDDEQLFFSRSVIQPWVGEKAMTASQILTRELDDSEVQRAPLVSLREMSGIVVNAFKEGLSRQNVGRVLREVMAKQDPLKVEASYYKDDRLVTDAVDKYTWATDAARVNNRFESLLARPLDTLAIRVAMPAEAMPHIEGLQFAPAAKPADAQRVQKAYAILGDRPSDRASYLDKVTYIVKFENILYKRNQNCGVALLKYHLGKESAATLHERFAQQFKLERILNDQPPLRNFSFIPKAGEERFADLPRIEEGSTIAEKAIFAQLYKNALAGRPHTAPHDRNFLPIWNLFVPLHANAAPLEKLERMLRVSNLLDGREEDTNVHELTDIDHMSGNAPRNHKIAYTMWFENMLKGRADLDAGLEQIEHVRDGSDAHAHMYEKVEYGERLKNLFHGRVEDAGLGLGDGESPVFRDALLARRRNLRSVCAEIQDTDDMSVKSAMKGKADRYLPNVLEVAIPEGATAEETLALKFRNVMIREHNRKANELKGVLAVYEDNPDTKNWENVKLMSSHIITATARSEYNLRHAQRSFRGDEKSQKLYQEDIDRIIADPPPLSRAEVQKCFDAACKEIPELEKVKKRIAKMDKLAPSLYDKPMEYAKELSDMLDDVSPMIVDARIQDLLNNGRLQDAVNLLNNRKGATEKVRDDLHTMQEAAMKRIHEMKKIKESGRQMMKQLAVYALMYAWSNAQQALGNASAAYQQFGNSVIRQGGS